MKNNKYILVIILVVILFCVSCGKTSDTAKDGVVQSGENLIEKPVAIEPSNKETTIELLDNKTSIHLSKNIFQDTAYIDVKNPENVPLVKQDEAKLLGNPIDIILSEESKRFDNKVVITFKLSQAELEEITEPGEIWAAYYNGVNWDYIEPNEVNLAGGYMNFSTYHFSLFAKAKVTDKQRIKEFANRQAVEIWAKNNTDTQTKETTKAMVKEILARQLGITNKTIIDNITDNIIKSNEYGGLLLTLQEGKNDEFGTGLSVLAGKKILEVVSDLPENVSSEALGFLTENASKVGTGVNMAVALANGDFEEAAKYLSSEIIDTYPITKLFKTAIEITDSQIKKWKSEELEAAYQVYLNGAESSIPWWGYQVEKGNFEDVWDQMKGLQVKIFDDAIGEYEKLHNVSRDNLSAEKLDEIRKQAKEDIKKEFETRREQETEIEKIKEENIKIIEHFQATHLLEKGRFGYPEDCSLELRLKRLYLIKDMILRDTNRKLSFGKLNTNNDISVNTMSELIQTWYLEDGKEKYHQKLIDLGLIEEQELKNAFILTEGKIITEEARDWWTQVAKMRIKVQDGNISFSGNRSDSLTKSSIKGLKSMSQNLFITLAGSVNEEAVALSGTYEIRAENLRKIERESFGEKAIKDYKTDYLVKGKFTSTSIASDKVILMFEGTWNGTSFVLNNTGNWQKEYDYPEQADATCEIEFTIK